MSPRNGVERDLGVVEDIRIHRAATVIVNVPLFELKSALAQTGHK